MSCPGYVTNDSDASLTKSNLHLTECLRHSNLADLESTSPIFELEFHDISLMLKGVKVVLHPSLASLSKDTILLSLGITAG